MSVYSRFKRDPSGFRQLVELLESTPPSRRQKMIDVGMKEDPEFTKKAMSFVFSFQDILGLADMELAEVLQKVPGKTVGFALHGLEEAVQKKCIGLMKPPGMGEAKEFLDATAGNNEINGARLKVISTARELEKRGLVKSKRIPENP